MLWTLRPGAERCGTSAHGEDNDLNVGSRIQRNLGTAVKKSELLIAGVADVVKQIEVAEIRDEKKEELMEEVLDKILPEEPFVFDITPVEQVEFNERGSVGVHLRIGQA